LKGYLAHMPSFKRSGNAVVKIGKEVQRCESDLLVSKNLLEHIIFICYAAKVVPDFRLVLSSGKKIRGKCVKYQWTEPRSLLLMVSNEEEISFVMVNVTSIQAIYMLNWAKLKYSREVDEGKYLRFIDDQLPEMVRGKKDECGNLWNPNN